MTPNLTKPMIDAADLPERVRLFAFHCDGGRIPHQYYCSHCRQCVPIGEVTSGGYHTKDGASVDRSLPCYTTSIDAQKSVLDAMMARGWQISSHVLPPDDDGRWLAQMTRYAPSLYVEVKADTEAKARLLCLLYARAAEMAAELEKKL